MRTEKVELYQHFNMIPPMGTSTQLEILLPEKLEVQGKMRFCPAVLILPGGGYMGVSKREAEPIALRFLAKGYAVFMLRYSCYPHAYPVALREAAMAMKYIRQQAPRLQIQSNMVAAVGFSAGGHLCGTLGTRYDGEEVSDIASAEELRPDVLGLCYPVAVSWGRTHEGSFERLAQGDQALWEKLSLDRCVRPDMPPAFIWHTRVDATVPCRNSLILATAMEEAGVPFALHIYHQGEHGLSVADETVYPGEAVPAVSEDVYGWTDAMLGFFREQGLRIVDMETLP